MDPELLAVWERECVFAVLNGRQLCPRYGLPCHICIVLHYLTGTLRSVTEGRFDRFPGRALLWWDQEPRSIWLSPRLVCPHHPEALNEQYIARHGRHSYWHNDFSLTTTPVTPAKDGERHGTLQARQVS